MSANELPDYLSRPRQRQHGRGRPRAPLERSTVAWWIVSFVLGLAWGVLFRRTEPLAVIGSPIPTVAFLLGPVALIGFLIWRVVTGTFSLRNTGVTALLAFAGAAISSSLTPGLSSAVYVSGTVSAEDFAGRSYSIEAECLWGPGRQTVARVEGKLPGGIGDVSGRILVIDLEGSAVYLREGGPSLTLASGPGAVEQPSGTPTRPDDRSSGSIALDQTRGPYSGTLRWECKGPTGSDPIGVAERGTAR